MLGVDSILPYITCISTLRSRPQVQLTPVGDWLDLENATSLEVANVSSRCRLESPARGTLTYATEYAFSTSGSNTYNMSFRWARDILVGSACGRILRPGSSVGKAV